MRLKEHERSYRLSFDNGISVEILRRGGLFGGLGQVKLRRRKLRCTELPVMPLVRTPDGYEVSRLQFQHIEKGEESLTLSLTPYLKRGGRTEWVCCDGEDRLRVGPWEQDAERDRGGSLRIVLRAVSRTIGGTQFAGFSYSYKFRSRKYRIYRIHDRATWELGGSATGNSFWMQGPFNEPQKTFRNKNDAFTTAWCRSGGGTVLQQFLPLFGALQGFAFQFDRQNLLVTAFEAPFHCRSLFQKNRGENHFVHWHQLCADLATCLEFPALQVLCAESPGEGLPELADRYCAIREELQRDYAEQCGLVREGVAVSGRLVAGEIPGAEALQRGLDKLAHAGSVRVYVSGLMRSAAQPPDSGAGADAPAPSETEARRRASRFVEHAHHRGMEVAVSLADCCAPWLLAGSVQGESQNPGAGEVGAALVAGALRNKRSRRLLLDHLRTVKRELGVDALFADSTLDGIADQFDWVWPAGRGEADARSGGAVQSSGADAADGEIRSLQGRRNALIASLQRMGYRCSLAGVSGLAGPTSAPAYERLKGLEFMFRDSVLDFPYDAIVESGTEP
ncbi:MAG: hypothetical protein KAX19_06015, partial [Candidatus Brocadiae bacterium]|nr:hypothetical protein [Candidatus Brocadiia bacterium]